MVDDEDSGCTDMVDCRCIDITDAGLQVMCVSLPIQYHLTDDEDQHLEYTVHRVCFVEESDVDLTCQQVTIRVETLRFSRENGASNFGLTTKDSDKRIPY